MFKQPSNGHHRSVRGASASAGFVRDSMDEPRRHGLASLHQRTTGRPKGVVHVHEAVVAHHITGRLALDLHSDDIFWCTADPGWVTGTSYGIISPLTNGATLIVHGSELRLTGRLG